MFAQLRLGGIQDDDELGVPLVLPGEEEGQREPTGETISIVVLFARAFDVARFSGPVRPSVARAA
eukprot:7103046-Lingulodinium_polyedra.AAC.1